MATVTIRKMNSTEAEEPFVPTHVWWARAEDLITGRSPGFTMTFGGTPEDAAKAIDSAIVCLARYRKRAAQQGRFKDKVYIMAKRGNQLFVRNVDRAEARKLWAKYDRWMPREGHSTS